MWTALGAFLLRDLQGTSMKMSTGAVGGYLAEAPALSRQKANSLCDSGNLPSIQSGMASSSTPTSLRDLYAAPPDGWSFFPAPEDLASLGTKSQTSSWPSRSADSHVFNLSPIDSDVVSLDLRVMVKALVASGALQYATTAIAMPFEVGKVLLQIQWIPKDHLGSDTTEPAPPDQEEDSVRWFML
jgi:hypothetical protein